MTRARVLLVALLGGATVCAVHRLPVEPPPSVCVSHVVSAQGAVAHLRERCAGTLAWVEFDPVTETVDGLCLCNERPSSAPRRIARYGARTE